MAISRVGLLGASGQMGLWVQKVVATELADQVKLSTLKSRADSLEKLLKTQVVIDFSRPEAMEKLAEKALRSTGTLPAFVIGSTGWKDLKRIEKLALKTPVLVAPNFSFGVHIAAKILKENAPLLASMGFTASIVETHHRHKKDAPSGTALFLRKAIQVQAPQEVPTFSVRAGEVIGDHEVTFFGQAERLVISHHAQDRSIFARGAVQVALWILKQKLTKKDLPKRILTMSDYFDFLEKMKTTKE